jgi:hypothetical protein
MATSKSQDGNEEKSGWQQVKVRKATSKSQDGNK